MTISCNRWLTCSLHQKNYMNRATFQRKKIGDLQTNTDDKNVKPSEYADCESTVPIECSTCAELKQQISNLRTVFQHIQMQTEQALSSFVADAEHKDLSDRYVDIGSTQQLNESFKTREWLFKENLKERLEEISFVTEADTGISTVSEESLEDKNPLARQHQEEENYLRLLSLAIGLAMDVAHRYFETVILREETFSAFMDKQKHQMFHMYCPGELCCSCQHDEFKPTDKIPKLSKGQFDLLYKKRNESQSCRRINLRKNTNRLCLCHIASIENLSIDNLDISLLIAVLKNCCPSAHEHLNWFEKIREVRNLLEKSNEIVATQFDEIWETLSANILNIASAVGSSYAKEKLQQIENLKRKTFSVNEMKSVMWEWMDKSKQELQQLLIEEQKRSLQKILDMQNEQVEVMKKMMTTKEEEIKATTSDTLSQILTGERLQTGDIIITERQYIHLRASNFCPRCFTSNNFCQKHFQPVISRGRLCYRVHVQCVVIPHPMYM